MKIKKIITILASLIITINCSKKKPLVFDINLISKSNQTEIEKFFGKAETSIVKIDYPCEAIKCLKNTYKNESLEIIFKDNSVARLTYKPKELMLFEEDSIQYFGLITKSPSFQSANTVLRWNNFENFQEISIFSNGRNYIDYILFQILF